MQPVQQEETAHQAVGGEPIDGGLSGLARPGGQLQQLRQAGGVQVEEGADQLASPFTRRRVGTGFQRLDQPFDPPHSPLEPALVGDAHAQPFRFVALIAFVAWCGAAVSPMAPGRLFVHRPLRESAQAAHH